MKEYLLFYKETGKISLSCNDKTSSKVAYLHTGFCKCSRKDLSKPYVGCAQIWGTKAEALKIHL